MTVALAGGNGGLRSGDYGYWIGYPHYAGVTVTDDDTAPEIALSLSPNEVYESETLTVTVSHPGGDSAQVLMGRVRIEHDRAWTTRTPRRIRQTRSKRALPSRRGGPTGYGRFRSQTTPRGKTTGVHGNAAAPGGGAGGGGLPVLDRCRSRHGDGARRLAAQGEHCDYVYDRQDLHVPRGRKRFRLYSGELADHSP